MQLLIDRSARFWIAASLIALLALALRLTGLNKGMWYDEFQAVYDFAGNTGFRQTALVLRYDIHPPLYFWILQVWRRVGGDGELYLRLLTVTISMAWLGIAIIWLKSYYRGAALLAGLMIATSPFLLRYGQEIKNYALLLFAAVLAFYFVSGFLRDPGERRYPLLAGVALAAAVSTHLMAVFLPLAVLAFAAVTVVLKPGQRLRDLIPLVAPVLILPLLTAFFWLHFYFRNVPAQGTWIPRASWYFFSVLANTFMGIGTFPRIWQIASRLLLLSALVAAGFGNWRQGLPFLAAAATYFVQAILYSVFIRSVLVDRYFLPVLVLLIAWFSVQLATVRPTVVRRLGIVCVVLVAAMYSVQWVRFDAASPIEAWRELGHVMPSQIDSSTQVFVQYNFLPAVLRNYVPWLPPERIVAVPAGEVQWKSMAGGFSHAILVIRASDGFTPGFIELLATVRRRITRPGMVDVFYVGPLASDAFGQLWSGAAGVLGKPRQLLQQHSIGVAYFELAAEPR